MIEDPTLLYLEADDEVTSVVRRVRGTDAARVVIVAPGRSRAVSSVVALRLLARVGEEADRRISIVGDALTRSLATEAGLDAYASVDDARRAVPAPVGGADPRGASIHVVRRAVADDTGVLTSAGAGQGDVEAETRPVPIVRPAPPPRARTRPSPSAQRTLPLALLIGVAAVLLAGVGVLAAVVLPAATVTIVPRSEPLGPVPYEIRIDDPERVAGTAEATAMVTATGTYPIQAAATGAVVFRNWNFAPVEVAAGELVAAGDQAFATEAAIVVEPGSLTPEGRIQAGEAGVEVVAAAVGPAANVPANAIDTVLNEALAARLRGFPNNPEGLVINPEATAGGVDTTGPEFTQQDVDEGRASLLQSLDVAVADALASTSGTVFADPTEPPEAVIEGLGEVLGRRDEEAVEISGSLAYERLAVDPDEVVARAEERLFGDPGVVPAGHELLADTIEVVIGEARRDGDALVVSVGVTAASTPAIDRGAVLERIRGRSVDEARAALADLGEPVIELWPGWVESVPGLDWRIEVETIGEPAGIPQPSGSLAP